MITEVIKHGDRPVLDQVREYAVASALGGGWYRGKATQRFTCSDCGADIAEGTDLAVRSEPNRFRFLHGLCFEQYARK